MTETFPPQPAGGDALPRAWENGLCQFIAYYRASTDKQGKSGLGFDNLVAAPCGRCKLVYTIAIAPMESRRSQ